jgi:hypothetical protein
MGRDSRPCRTNFRPPGDELTDSRRGLRAVLDRRLEITRKSLYLPGNPGEIARIACLASAMLAP